MHGAHAACSSLAGNKSSSFLTRSMLAEKVPWLWDTSKLTRPPTPSELHGQTSWSHRESQVGQGCSRRADKSAGMARGCILTDSVPNCARQLIGSSTRGTCATKGLASSCRSPVQKPSSSRVCAGRPALCTLYPVYKEEQPAGRKASALTRPHGRETVNAAGLRVLPFSHVRSALTVRCLVEEGETSALCITAFKFKARGGETD